MQCRKGSLLNHGGQREDFKTMKDQGHHVCEITVVLRSFSTFDKRGTVNGKLPQIEIF